MASGRVIVAWDNVIFNQVMGKDSGYLVPPGDIDALAGAFYQILENRSVALKYAKRATEIMEGYSIDSQIKRYANLMDEIFG